MRYFIRLSQNDDRRRRRDDDDDDDDVAPLFTMFLQISAINVTYIFILCRSEHMNNMF